MKEPVLEVPGPVLFRLKVEISFSVIVRYILDHLVDECHLALRKLSVLEVFAEQVAEDSAEILVTRI